MPDTVELIRRLYAQFNARDMEGVLACLDEDVVWANGMEGGYVHGRNGVREYWTRQWGMIDPHVEPAKITAGPDGEYVVEVHAVVRDPSGTILSDRMVGHVFWIKQGLVTRFDIREPGK